MRLIRLFLLILIMFQVVEAVRAEIKIRTLANKVTGYLDYIAKKRVDSNYIEVPKYPWRIMERTNINEVSLDFDASQKSEDGYYGINTRVSTGIDVSTGFRIGYRTINVGYMLKLGHLKGSSFSFGTNGNRFGFNVHLRRFKNDEISAYYTSVKDTIDNGDLFLSHPVNIKSLLVDGYYVFNNRHFSNAATRSLGFIQRRSAGSFLVGASYLDAKADYAHVNNWALISGMNNIGKIRMRQINLSAGYAYNWVPLKGWVFNLTLMPQISVDNRLYLHKYDLMFDYVYDEFGNIISGDYDNWRIENDGRESIRSHVRLSCQGRAAVVYNSKRLFVSLTGQWQQYKFRLTESSLNEINNHIITEKTKGKLTDWTVTANIGYRF